MLLAALGHAIGLVYFVYQRSLEATCEKLALAWLKRRDRGIRCSCQPTMADASKAFADIDRLTKLVAELEPLAAVAKHNMEEKARAEADAAEWQRVGCVLLAPWSG